MILDFGEGTVSTKCDGKFVSVPMNPIHYLKPVDIYHLSTTFEGKNGSNCECDDGNVVNVHTLYYGSDQKETCTRDMAKVWDTLRRWVAALEEVDKEFHARISYCVD